MSEKLCLKWNDFQDNTNNAFGSMRNDVDFSDVTLACEDGEQVEAHKVILAASSPFFQQLLRRNKHPHPLVYMRGVKSEDLVAIIDFLYYGEANVYQENIDAFLAIAEELKLKGLTGNTNHEQSDKTLPLAATNKVKTTPKSIKAKVEHSKTYDKFHDHSFEAEQVESALAVQSYEVSHVNLTDAQELDAKVKSMMTKSQNIIHGRKADICTVCGKEGMGKNIMEHIEANHLEGVSLPCNVCGKTFRSRHSLGKHIRIHI